MKIKHYPYILLLLALMTAGSATFAGQAILKGRITMQDGSLPATVVLHCYADESFSAASNIAKDGTFAFSADVPRATLYNIRFLRSTYDVMLSPAEKETRVNITLNKEMLVDINTENSLENDAYKAFHVSVNRYDGKLRDHFVYCENEDSCEKELHKTLVAFQQDLSGVEEKYKGTYTADVLCKMRMPVIAKNVRNTSEEFRAGFFENVPFGDSTIFSTPVYKDMIADYSDFLMEPSLTKEGNFVKYFTEKIKANEIVLHRSAFMLFDELFRDKKEKTLAMFIAWYNTGDNKAKVNNPVLDTRLNNISKVMPGQPYIDASAPDSTGNVKSLKEIVDHSKCTLLLFWSSECSHCREEMPEIKEYYEKYHAKGFNIYAVSLEGEKDKWKKFVRDNGLSWTNVIVARDATPNAAMQYVVTTTPTLVLIDNKGIILHRFISKGKLGKYIADAVK